MQLGKLGVWQFTDGMTAAEAAAFAQRVEKWGYSALWIPEATGREPFAHAAWLLANTKKLIVATGIANIYARDARASVSGQNTLAEQSGGRFLLGLGVSHAPLVEGVRGHSYGAPVATMKAYLEAMKGGAPYSAVPPAEAPPTVIVALGPKMLELAKTHAAGAHPYLVTPEHTAQARKILGAGPMLCVEQMALRESDPVRARDVARRTIGFYLALPNYRNNLLRLGYSAQEIDDKSDRVTDAIVAWGDAKKIRERIDAHFQAGASHVCIQAIPPGGGQVADDTLLAELAPGG
jgi:probable F420-dependent oxidoreductase